jgi:predicted P-loop ATPase
MNAGSIKDFMSSVVPWPTDDEPGYINVHWHLPGRQFKGLAVKTLDEFIAAVDDLRDRKSNLYFCLSHQKEARPNGKGYYAVRSGPNALAFKAIWFDIDVKLADPKSYHSSREALAALSKFVESADIPPPSAIVASGSGGFHVYWFSRTPLRVDEWREYATGLREAAEAHGLKIDAGCTTDAARVLRIPETLNYKSDPPKPVKLMGLGEDYEFAQALKAIRGKTWRQASSHLPRGRGTLPSIPERFRGRPVDTSLSAGIEGGEMPPLHPLPIIQECGFLRHAFKTGGEDYTQPLWNLTTLCATFMEKGNEFAHRFGNKHRGYSHESTDELWERKLRERKDKDLGWPSCATIRGAGSPFCAKCPHFVKSKSPLHLGLASTAVDHSKNTLPVAVTTVNFRDRDRFGNPRPSLANAVTATRALGITARYDLFHHRIEVTYKGDSKTIREGLLTDDTVSAIRSLINNTYRIDCGDSNTFAAIKEIAMHNAYDPVLDMLNDCQGKWDGVKRIDTWTIDYLGCKDTPLNRAIGRLVLIAACRRARQPGCKFDSITVLEGVEGTNKSTAIRILAGDENFSDQSIIGASDKEVQEQLDGVWMHENADLAGMRRADVEQVKAFASRQVDRARPAYGRVREDRPRRSIEWGTTNNNEYLLSQTGNRRFWPLKTGKINIEALKRDREQLLGEAATYEVAAESIMLNEELWGDARDAQEQRRVVDPWEDVLANMPDSVEAAKDGMMKTVTVVHKSDDGYERVASADVLTHVLQIPTAQQTSVHGQRLALAMEHAGWSRNPSGRVTIGGKPVRGYVRPAHK